MKYTNKGNPDFELLTKAHKLAKEVNKKNNDSMGKYISSKRKIGLNEICSKYINLMLSHRLLIAEIKDLFILDFEKKERKSCFVSVFTDCLVIFLTGKHGNKDEYYTHLLFNELSYAISVDKMKYYDHIFKVCLVC